MNRIVTIILLFITSIMLNVVFASQQSVPQFQSIQFPFIENHGQLNKEILYYTTTRNGALYIDTTGKEYLSLRLKDDSTRLVISKQFVGTKNTKPVGKNPAKTRINRYIGNDPDKWQQGIPTWNQPANACLASRVQYGEKITIPKLKQIEQAEDILRHYSPTIRVRLHHNITRIEVPIEYLQTIIKNRTKIISQLKTIGLTYITLDLEGHRSGSMHEGK